MKPIERPDILDLAAYEKVREDCRRRILEIKEARRIHIGEHLTLLFETTETMRYQVQEMLRAERITREADIRHEIDTYNEVLGAAGELGCTLLIEIEDPALRRRKLAEWLALPEHLYLLLPDGTKARPRFDERQRGEDALSAVQYLKFDVRGEVPVAAGVELPGAEAEARLTSQQRAALREDLA